jgi:hypothetical protein
MRRMNMTTRRMWNPLVIAACSVMITASACSAGESSRSASKTTEQPSLASQTESVASPAVERFDSLSISLRLHSTTVQQGETLRSRVFIENNSPDAVVDPDCVIAEGRYALVPVDQPDAELWVRPMTDCGGPFRMAPGFRTEHDGPDFYARTKYGEPLPPGEYLAVLDIKGLSQRLEYPVSVTR